MSARHWGVAVAVLGLLGASAACAQDAPPALAAGCAFVTLGTASGPAPHRERAQPANVLRCGDDVILIDAGDGAAQQLGRAGIALGDVDAVLLSHLHFDHTGGLFAFLSRRFQNGYRGPLTVYGPPGTKRTLDALIAAMQPMVADGGWLASPFVGTPGAEIASVELVDGAKLRIGAVAVSAALNSHYVLSDPDGKGSHSLAYRFDLADRSIVYTGDTGPSSRVEQLAKGADLLITEIMDPEESMAALVAARPDLPWLARRLVKNHFVHQHLSPNEVGQLAQRSGAKALVLTHIALARASLGPARSAIAKHFAGPVAFAEDLKTY